jgi:hypothetical protein
MVHDNRGRCRLVLAERRIGGAINRGDSFAQHIAQRLPAFDDASDRARECNRCIPISSERELVVCGRSDFDHRREASQSRVVARRWGRFVGALAARLAAGSSLTECADFAKAAAAAHVGGYLKCARP